MIKNWRLTGGLLATVAMWLALMIAPPAFADNTVNLKVLVISTGDETQDLGLSYIKPVLDEIGVLYDVLNANTQDLTADMLASLNGVACNSVDAGCVGSYNGIILTISDLTPNFTPAEWDILHNYEKDFKVREAVLSGWPATYFDPNAPFGIYLDYGLVFSSSGASYNTQWSVPAAYQKEVLESVNLANPLPITDFAFAATPRNDAVGPRDGTIPSVMPLLQTTNGEALLSIVQYKLPNQTTPLREVMISTISHASFLIHSKVLAYEFINWATQGVFVGARRVHMAAHLDDLFLANTLYDPSLKADNPLQSYRLNSSDISNLVEKQAAFRATHPTAGAFKLDFPFNGSGAVIDPEAPAPVANLTEDLVAAVIANKDAFRYINHTFTHADMDKPPVPANAPCDYETFTTVAPIQAEITKNRTVWGLLGLPEQANNNRVLLTGNHAGLKDRKCTDDPLLHTNMANVQDDDVAFDQGGANPLFLRAAANTNVQYIASDSSQRAQNVEQYITQYDDGKSTDRIMLPRWPTNVFVNVINPDQLVDEYNYMFHDRFVNAGQDPCSIPGAICTPRSYAEILAAEADNAVRHMLSFNKWPHFFHQSNAANYANGNTLIFDWLNAVFAAYERLFKLPVLNLPYWQIGDKTKQRLDAKTAIIQAKWNRSTNQVALSANKAITLEMTGITGGGTYGGQFVRAVNVTTTPTVFTVNRGLTQ
ncbi:MULTISPECIES: Agd3-related carbohydrate deacetylase [Nitrosomonas]|uniref:Agd3 deacetylase domain-containing protein n=1 Tax=Nitrosomonas communis TaxID=44574 RepID=A0A0F7KB00_9PROT|nr:MULTISPECIES: hypothetical protein [Nitrosomonas]AKH36781.1 hypothetical protein AAW31_01475 [Nitrosomonas communis]TYP86695.1 hypothetical protein BCL69_102929 [Nitrosomonas communis]UVS61850.1 hypothetical protein NX761_01555 [Nitrosomonas sp. PLL12]